MRGIIRTAALFLWAPATAGTLASVVTWLVWFYTALPCTEETALTLLCQPTPLARYVSSAVLNDCFIHSGVAITIMGGSDLMLFIRERRRTQEERQRADRMMDLMKETIDQLAEERRQAYEQIKQATEQAAAERRLLDEQWAEARRLSEERVAEARRAAEERRLLAEERAAEERRLAEERAAEARRLAEERAAEERRLLAEERRYAAEQLAEERRYAAEERQAFLDTLTKLTEAIGRNGQNHG